MSKQGKALSKALGRPDEWESDRMGRMPEYRVIHRPSGLKLWIANGVFFFDFREQVNLELGILERHWLYWKYRRKVYRHIKKNSQSFSETDRKTIHKLEHGYGIEDV